MNNQEARTTVAKNGYHYTQLETGKWRLTHHIIAEEKLGRAVDSSQERVKFVDGDRTNLTPENVTVVPLKRGVEQRIANIREKIRVLQEELDELLQKSTRV